MEGCGIDEKMEESSWTFYIEGFICDNNKDKDDDDHSFCSSQPESPSLVSDAASSAVKKLADWKENIGLSKQNSFKKKKTKAAIHVDYDLEDTASSPVNSPKVSLSLFNFTIIYSSILLLYKICKSNLNLGVDCTIILHLQITGI